MKLRKGDVVLIKATVASIKAGEPDSFYATIGGSGDWRIIQVDVVDRVLRQHLEPGDRVQGGKVLLLWPEEDPTHVIVEMKNGPPLPVALSSPVARRLEDGEEPASEAAERRVPLFPDPETYSPQIVTDEQCNNADERVPDEEMSF